MAADSGDHHRASRGALELGHGGFHGFDELVDPGVDGRVLHPEDDGLLGVWSVISTDFSAISSDLPSQSESFTQSVGRSFGSLDKSARLSSEFKGGDLGMYLEEVLDLLRVDVLSAGFDEVPGAVDHLQPAVAAQLERVAGVVLAARSASAVASASSSSHSSMEDFAGCNVVVAISLLHDDSVHFADPERFDSARFLGTTPFPSWLPFGGGTRRCIGAAFATMEMDV